MNSINEVCFSFLDGLEPISSQTVTEWSNENQYLSSVSSAEPGKYNSGRTPYCEEVMDKLSPTDPTQEIWVMKSVQLAFTTIGMNLIGTYIDLEPCSILYVLPTVDIAKGFSQERIAPMIENCPALSDKIKDNSKKNSGNNILKKAFPGGILALGGANSGASLRSRPVRVLILDETDAYPLEIPNEGSPITLAKKRTTTFDNKKIYGLSTPTVHGISVIEKEIEDTDKRMYFVPLSCCGTYQTLEFKNLVWEGNNPSEVKYKCPHCGELIEERTKPLFLREGEWRATQPEKSSVKKVGYIINGLYSPLGWMSWLEIVTEYLKVKDDPIEYRAFVNTVLGEVWKEKGESPPWENLYNRRESYEIGKIPSDNVAFLTAGVDIQKDRIEMEIVGWGKGKESWSVEYKVLPGDVVEQDVWNMLNEEINRQYQKPNGMILPIRLTAIDSGYETTKVYDFCRKFPPSKVIPIKGSDSQATIVVPPRTVDISRGGKKIGKVKVWNVGVSILKQELYSLLRLEQREDNTFPPGFCHFPQYDRHYFKGITAEELQYKIVKGFKKYEWVKTFERNEPLDLRNYARAAANVVGIDRFNDKDWSFLLVGTSSTRKKRERKRDSSSSIW